jgi:hypothetical protein
LDRALLAVLQEVDIMGKNVADALHSMGCFRLPFSSCLECDMLRLGALPLL